MAVIEPEMAILDETDSGLDIDALRIVAEGVNAMLNRNLGVLLITGYQRLLNYQAGRGPCPGPGPHRQERGKRPAHDSRRGLRSILHRGGLEVLGSGRGSGRSRPGPRRRGSTPNEPWAAAGAKPMASRRPRRRRRSTPSRFGATSSNT